MNIEDVCSGKRELVYISSQIDQEYHPDAYGGVIVPALASNELTNSVCCSLICLLSMPLGAVRSSRSTDFGPTLNVEHASSFAFPAGC